MAGAVVERAIRDVIDGGKNGSADVKLNAREWLASGGADIWLSGLDLGDGDVTGVVLLAAIDAGRITTGGAMQVDGLGVGKL